MLEEIRFAIIGTSDIAKTHIQAIKKCSTAEKHYIYSRDRNRSKLLAEHYGLIPVQSYEDILSNDNIHAVDIVTEPDRHAILALEAIKHNKHVLIEKPLDISILRAKRVLEESEKALTVTSVISQNRFDPVIRKMKKKLSEGAIGKPYIAEVKVFWRRTEEYYNHGVGWRSQYGNVLINQASHYIDFAVWIFGVPVKVNSLIKKVKPNISCYDTALLSMEFSNDVFFNLICTTACHESEPFEFNIFGTEGKLSYNVEKILSFEKQSKERGFRHFIKSIIKKDTARKIPSLFEYQMNDFINAIINKRPPAVTVREAFEVLKIIDICEKNYN